MKKFDLVVFDIAGTTVFDKGSVAEAFIRAIAEAGMKITIEDAKKVMGWRKIDAIRMLVSENYPQRLAEDESLVDRIHDAFIRNMIAFYRTDPDLQPQPYAEQLFRILKEQGIKVALNTGFTRAITDTILERLDWVTGKNIDAVICSDEVPRGRPYPFMIQKIMEKLQVKDAARVVKVGDTEIDVEEGRNAGCGLVLGVTTGAYTRQQLMPFHPDAIIDSLSELPALIK